MSSSDSEGPTSPKVCLACGQTSKTNLHFGGFSCTACASFFRRTVSLNIRYVCKRENDCISSPELRSICRACRYDCCVNKAGMNREMVQQRRSENRIPKYILNSRRSGDGEVVRDYTTNSYTTLHEFPVIDSSSSETTLTLKNLKIDIESFENPDVFSKILNISHIGLLEFYVKQVKRSKDINPLNISEASDLKKIVLFHQELALETCTNCPGTDLLDGEDIEVLFRYCTFSTTWMDSCWVASLDESSDLKEIDVSNDSDLHRFISQLKSTIIPSFSRLHLNIFEFAALKSFCIWKLGVHDSTISMKIVAQEQYIGVTSALRKYYETSSNMEPFAIATRIAEITLQIGPIFGAYREMMKVYDNLEISMATPSLENI